MKIQFEVNVLLQGRPGEPVYAQVNRDKKKNRQNDGQLSGGVPYEGGAMSPPDWSYEEQKMVMLESDRGGGGGGAGDSWV